MSKVNYNYMGYSEYLPAQLKENGLFTPDIPYLNQFENHYIFTYGTLKRGFSRSHMLQVRRNKFCGIGVTDKEDFDMLLAVNSDGRSSTQFPVAFENLGDTSRNGKVKGELWLIDTRTLLNMDRIESNGHIYDRVWTPIWVGSEKVYAFMYVGVKDFWKHQSDIIDIPMLKQNGKKYHFYHEGMCEKIKAAHISQFYRGSEIMESSSEVH